ncbi:hypothetical protein BDP55DRAFT_399051 [Colletotrichum godetiae]|uniref:Transmembrane protein n=1 Tax=Colletotrichum godetiae TaxID=1209918 RepID=A0AAJ0A960_9PEZI|nr:uncharacterized protein BDP55DRAFT_399051 [Colletotrichum godetiae]KAK1658304.1 hypothetical protein BDP55DRAFT_399051 [Colletotrichum godetiae]
MFTTHRTDYKASWRVTRQSLRLQPWNCSTAEADILRQTPIFSGPERRQFSPFSIDALPIMGRLLSDFPEPKNRADSPWKMPSFAVAVVGWYWARRAYMISKLRVMNKLETVENSRYAPRDESFKLTRKILHPYWWLYLVLGVQPLIAVAAFFANHFWLGRDCAITGPKSRNVDFGSMTDGPTSVSVG